MIDFKNKIIEVLKKPDVTVVDEYSNVELPKSSYLVSKDEFRLKLLKKQLFKEKSELNEKIYSNLIAGLNSKKDLDILKKELRKNYGYDKYVSNLLTNITRFIASIFSKLLKLNEFERILFNKISSEVLIQK